jgi:hypothetical protein
MREQAVQKLSKAYHLDEIASSVATMQSASTLEDVASLVLQRNPLDSDAKYVHFFHEKIPSRQLAECTSLQPLDEVIADRPNEGEILRTRAVTRIFKEDYVGAARDLTSALQVCRYVQSQHKAGRQQLQLASEIAAEKLKIGNGNGRWREDIKIEEEDQPSSLETQLLFQRAGVYLTIACQYVGAALLSKSDGNGVNGKKKGDKGTTNGSHPASDGTSEPPELTPAEKEVLRKRQEARKIVKTNAKRALRDYVAYLAHFDYTPGLPAEMAEEFIRKVNQAAANGFKPPRASNDTTKPRNLDLETNNSLSNGQLSDALVPHKGPQRSRTRDSPRPTDLPHLPPPTVHPVSALFSATPPSDLPPYPEPTTTLTIKAAAFAASAQSEAAKAILAQSDCHEALTYHPLLTDALHSLLLCHCLVQTSARELHRHAYMVARLCRVCDGYPIFQAARSPSRADWMEVLRRSPTITLSASWESLCAPDQGNGSLNGNLQKETPGERKERLRQQAIMEALEDDRVCDEESFHRAVRARERRQEEERDGNAVKERKWDVDRDYPVCSERAEAVGRWMREAVVGGGEGKRKKKAGDVKAKGTLEKEMNGLKVQDEEFEVVEEEVD